MPRKSEQKPVVKTPKRGQVDNAKNTGNIKPEPKYIHRTVRIDEKTEIKSKDIHLSDEEIVDKFNTKMTLFKPNYLS